MVGRSLAQLEFCRFYCALVSVADQRQSKDHSNLRQWLEDIFGERGSRVQGGSDYRDYACCEVYCWKYEYCSDLLWQDNLSKGFCNLEAVHVFDGLGQLLQGSPGLLPRIWVEQWNHWWLSWENAEIFHNYWFHAWCLEEQLAADSFSECCISWLGFLWHIPNCTADDQPSGIHQLIPNP